MYIGIRTIAERLLCPQHAHAGDVAQGLLAAGIRVEVDERSETLGFKIREAEVQKIPLTLVIGEKEQTSGTVTPRLRKSKKTEFEALEVNALITQLRESISERRMGPLS